MQNTVAARMIHEMKTEIDNYSGRDGEPGMIDKYGSKDFFKCSSTLHSQK
jgi:hypothetical protein